MKKTWISFLLILSACASEDKNYFESDKHFSHALFSSEEECLNHQPRVNCNQEVYFDTKGRAQYLLTDIMHQGKYELSGNQLFLKGQDDLGHALQITFTIVSATELKKEDGTHWFLK